MTIRQQGGIFGRNPTFNNVTVDGILTVDQIVEKTGAAGITLDGVTLKDGNVVLANGKGIDFSATAGTGTSELFDDYEEGTWTPALSGYSGTTYTSQSGQYVKLGGVVHIWFEMVIDSAGTFVSNSRIVGAPFVANMGVTGAQAGLLANSSGFADVRNDQYLAFFSTGSSIFVYTNQGSTRNANLYRSGVISGQITYPAA